MKARHQIVILCFFLVFVQRAAWAVQNIQNAQNNATNNSTTTVRGQILMPDGNVPTLNIRFDLDGSNGYHDIRFTDSNGRIILERLPSDVRFTILVKSDELNWGDTQFKFVPGNNGIRGSI